MGGQWPAGRATTEGAGNMIFWGVFWGAVLGAVLSGSDDFGPFVGGFLGVVIDRLPSGAFDASGREVHVVGDAAEIGNLWAAIRTGNAAGRSI